MPTALVRAALAAVAVVAAAWAEAPVTIDRLAPRDSWFVIGVDDLVGTRQRWDRTAVIRWWNSEPIQKLVREDMEASRKQAAERLRELGVPEDAWSLPRVAGAALYAARDEDLDSDQAHFLAYGDWGEHAEGVGAIMDALIAEQERKRPGATTGVEIAGHKATRITVRPEEAAPEVGPDGRPRRPRPRRGGLFGEGGTFQHVEHIWYLRHGERLLLGSVERDLAEAIEVLEGGPDRGLPDEAAFRDGLAQVGRGDGWAVLLTEPMQRVAGTASAQLGFLQPMLTTLFGQVKAYAFGLRSDESGVQFDLLSGILVEGERRGVLALPDPAVAIAPPPALVPGDAVGYGTIQIQFRDLMKLIETAVSAMPGEMAGMMEPTLQQYGPDLRKAFDALGPQVHVVTRSAGMPGRDAEENQQGIYAMACRDEQAVTGLLNLFLPEAGFQPRDFNGHTIFSAGQDEMSMGFGGGMFYMGTTTLVEQCLRGGQGGLADSPACRQSMGAAGSEPAIGWGFTDMVASLEASREALVAAASRAERGALPKGQRDLAGEAGIQLPEGLAESLQDVDAESLATGFGPMQWDLRPLPNGLLTRFRLLAPANAD
jgi:hypothetical protein